jgi:hypothetical protein
MKSCKLTSKVVPAMDIAQHVIQKFDKKIMKVQGMINFINFFKRKYFFKLFNFIF